MAASAPDVMDVPLFPLPGVVLFPGTLLPLRVFEPRYVQLLKDVLASDKLIGMAQLKPASFTEAAECPPVYDVLGTGLVVAHKELPDGTSHIALLGQARCKLTEEIPHTPYRVGRMVKLKDRMIVGVGEQKKLRAAQEQMMKAAHNLISRSMEGDSCAQFKQALEERADAGAAADLLASVYVQDNAMRQALLESLDVVARIRMVHAVLEKMLSRLEARPPALEYRHDNISFN